jgi:hypothetical protein
MLVKDVNSMESFIHVCEGMDLKRMQKHRNIEIRVHDIHVKAFVQIQNGYLYEAISFCPYCGADVDKEISEL